MDFRGSGKSAVFRGSSSAPEEQYSANRGHAARYKLS